MYILGILIGLYLDLSVAFLCVIFFIITIILNLFCKNKKLLILILLILLGSIYVNFLDSSYDEKYLNIPNEVTVKALVISEPVDKEYKYSYVIKVAEINNSKKYNGTKLILDINKNKLNGEAPKFGDEIEIIGELKKPDTARNYKGFNYKNYLKSKKIYGTITLEAYQIVGNDKVDGISRVINKIQKNIKENVNKILKKEEAALCIGILIGDREAISEETEDNFKKSNLTHMLAVSGSHITYIINSLAIILSKTGKKFAKIFTISFLIFFMALTGFTSSVIRACIMGILVLVASLLHRKPDTINNLGISAFIILIFNPYAINDVGFLLSYGGTIGIVVLGNRVTDLIYNIMERLTKGRIKLTEADVLGNEIKSNSIKQKLKKYLINSFSITLSANLIIIPIMAYNFSTISITFWISNILAAPVMEVVTILGFIVYFVSTIFIPFAEFLGIFLNLLLDMLLKIAEISSLIPGSSIYIKTPYVYECAIYYLLLFSLFNFKAIKEKFNILKNSLNKSNKLVICKILTNKKIILLCVIIIIISNLIIYVLPNSLRIYFVDVGQGDCTLIRTPTNKTILIDGGGSEFGSFDVGESTLLPYLLDRRITTIDYLMISHFDSDHVGGLFTIIENLKVKKIIISRQGENSENLKKFNELIKDKKINLIIVKKGDLIPVDKYSYFDILFPEERLINENVLNNNSIVANFHCRNFSMLFTGDIEEVAEKRLHELYEGTDKLNAIFLKVAHHGSKTSSTERFLNLVKPKVVFIGVGGNNKFGHPNESIIERLKKYTNLIYRTDKNGEISVIINKNLYIFPKKYHTNTKQNVSDHFYSSKIDTFRKE